MRTLKISEIPAGSFGTKSRQGLASPVAKLNLTTCTGTGPSRTYNRFPSDDQANGTHWLDSLANGVDVAWRRLNRTRSPSALRATRALPSGESSRPVTPSGVRGLGVPPVRATS